MSKSIDKRLGNGFKTFAMSVAKGATTGATNGAMLAGCNPVLGIPLAVIGGKLGFVGGAVEGLYKGIEKVFED